MKPVNYKLLHNLCLSILLMLFTISCTHNETPLSSLSQRSIAQENLSRYELNDFIEKSLEITKTNKQDDLDYSKHFNDNDFLLKLTKIDFVENSKLAKDNAYKIIPYLKDNKYHIQIQYSPLALNDKGAFNELKIFFSYFNKNKITPTAGEKLLKAITGKETYRESAFFELIYNAKKGYTPAVADLVSLRVQAKSNNFALFKEKLEYLKKHTKANKTDNLALYHKLYELKDDKDFLNRVSKNDRKSVASMIENKIPWDSLSPYENLFWKNQLETIKSPVPLEKRVLVYRGLKSTHLLDRFQVNLDKVFYDQKFYQVSNFFHASKNFDHDYLDSNIQTSYISNELKVHSLSSHHSLFISLTPSVNIAKGFAEDSIGVFAVDPRALFFNETSAFIDENEFLTSFVTFPEESLGIVELTAKDKSLNPVNTLILENKISKLMLENLRLRYPNGDHLYAQLKKNTSSHFRIINFDLKTTKSIFRTLLQQGLQPSSEVIVKKPNLLINECKNLIKRFF